MFKLTIDKIFKRPRAEYVLSTRTDEKEDYCTKYPLKGLDNHRNLW